MAGVRRKPQPSGKYQAWFMDMTGNRTFFVGTRSRSETVRMAQRLEDDHRQIRLGYRPAPHPTDRHRTRLLTEVVEEYLAWGQLQGGRRGYPWSPHHFENRRRHLRWWPVQLSLERLGDLEGCLPAVEAALQTLEPGHASKTLAQYAESLAAFCDWCVDRNYLSQDLWSAILSRCSHWEPPYTHHLSSRCVWRIINPVGQLHRGEHVDKVCVVAGHENMLAREDHGGNHQVSITLPPARASKTWGSGRL